MTAPGDEVAVESSHEDANPALKALRKEATIHVFMVESTGCRAASADRGAKVNTTCRSSCCGAEAACALRDHDPNMTDHDVSPPVNGLGNFDTRGAIAEYTCMPPVSMMARLRTGTRTGN